MVLELAVAVVVVPIVEDDEGGRLLSLGWIEVKDGLRMGESDWSCSISRLGQ